MLIDNVSPMFKRKCDPPTRLRDVKKPLALWTPHQIYAIISPKPWISERPTLLQRANEKNAKKNSIDQQKNVKEIHSARLSIGYTVTIRKYNPGLGNRNPELKRIVEQTTRIDSRNRPNTSDQEIINDTNVFLRRTPPPDNDSHTTMSDVSYVSAAESVATIIYPPTPAQE
uniref:Uncharacterized protein n=1 Tax=Rhizophagus irregularis (strain DAOM 181602 / DAOM 197198 / MUCL 43194) TaxID=747089 RepID=U9TPD2_RHIID